MFDIGLWILIAVLNAIGSNVALAQDGIIQAQLFVYLSVLSMVMVGVSIRQEMIKA